MIKKIKESTGEYYVTKDGYIYNDKTNYWTKGFDDGNGYLRFHIKLNKNKKKMVFVHRLIAEAFIPNTENKPFINHINGIKNDNRVENLEWCTISENLKHKFRIGLQSYKGEKNNSAKINYEIAEKIRDISNKTGFKARKLNKHYFQEYSVSLIDNVINNRNWVK